MINYNNTSKLFTSRVQDNSTLNLKSKASQVTSDTEFKSVFDKTLKSTNKSKVASNVPKDDNDMPQDTASKVKYKSFRAAQMAQKVNSKENFEEASVKNVKSSTADLESVKLENGSKEYDDQISVLAQMLGIQPNELVKLAGELGFSAEDLKDVKQLSLFMDKLASVLELSDAQKTMMNTIVTEVSKQVKTENNSEEIVTLENTKAVEASKEANTSSITKTINLSQIRDEVKAKLDQLINNATVNTESISSEISKVIEVMKSQSKAILPLNTEQGEAKSITANSTTDDILNSEQLSLEKNANMEKASAKANNSEEESESDNDESSNTKAEVNIKSLNTQVSVSNDENQQNVQLVGDVKGGMVSSQIEAQKSVSSLPQPIKSSEVLNQVVEQAKVVIGQDKAEMVIHLKPDNLGKLELKVVTEQGIVAAKFIAESHQVKDIIEANMQLLKDSMQKQGISIESVSVQVGPDKQSDYQQPNSYQSKNSSSSNRHKYGSSEVGIQKIGYNAFDELPERLAQYAYDSNTINLTA